MCRAGGMTIVGGLCRFAYHTFVTKDEGRTSTLRRSSFVVHPSLLLHLGDGLGIHPIVAEILRCRLVPAAEVADREQIFDGGELCRSGLGNIRVDRTQPVLREDGLGFRRE